MFKVCFSTPAKEAAARLYLQGTTRLEVGLRMERRDGQVFAWTRAQEDIFVPAMTWGNITIPPTLYVSGEGNFPKSIRQSSDIAQTDSWQFDAFTHPTDPNAGYVKEAEVARGLFRDAKFSLILFARDSFIGNSGLQFAWLRQRGQVGDKMLDKGRVTFRMNGLARLFASEVLEVTSPLSNKTWGDPELAGFNLNGNTVDGFAARVNTSVSALGGDTRRECFLTALIGFPGNRFTDGTVLWKSGANVGLTSSILSFNPTTGAVTFDQNTPYPMQLNDQLRAQIKAPQTLEEWILYTGDGFGFPAQPGMPTRDQGGLGR